MAGIVRRSGQPPVSIEAMNATIADAGASAAGKSPDGARKHWPRKGLPLTAEERAWLDMHDVGEEILPDDQWADLGEELDKRDRAMEAPDSPSDAHKE